MIVFIQDLKFRAIHVMLPAILFILGLVIFYIAQKEWMLLGYNALFLVSTFAGLYVYLMIKNKTVITSLSKTMGLGDILFFIAVVPFFGFHNYILYFITGMLFSIIGFLLIRMLSKTNLVPLAGLLSLYMVLLMGVDYFLKFDLFFGKIL